MPATRRRTTTKLLRLYPEELADITARAEACGRTAARFHSRAGFGSDRRNVDRDRLLRALARIGGELERAAPRPVQRGRGLADHVAAALDEHRALVAQVMSLKVSAGSRRARYHAPPEPCHTPIRKQAPTGRHGRAET